jgi:hypothetical protein
MKRLGLVLLVSSVALAQAGFVAKPYGNQSVNADGSITLDQGGTIADNKRGFTIDAKYIQYKDNAFLKARTAKIKNNTGESLSSPNIDYNVTSDRMSIAGPLSYTDENVSNLSGARAVAFPDAKKIVAFNVNASSPTVKANAAVFDNAKNEACLVGNYVYKTKDGKTTKSNAQASAILMVNFKNKDKPTFQALPSPSSPAAKACADLITKAGQ